MGLMCECCYEVEGVNSAQATTERIGSTTSGQMLLCRGCTEKAFGGGRFLAATLARRGAPDSMLYYRFQHRWGGLTTIYLLCGWKPLQEVVV
jgi:hypothetical protein